MKRSLQKSAIAVVSLSMIAAACGDSTTESTTADSTDGTTAESTTGDTTEGTTDGTMTEDTTDGTMTEDTTEGGTAAPVGEADYSDILVVEGLEPGGTVTITGPERDDPSVGSINEVLGAFGEANGIEITYTGDADWEANINTQVAGGNAPDISIFPQPGKLRSFADDGYLKPLNDAANASMDEAWDDKYQVFGQTSDGTQYGVPVKTDLKSVVWYQPSRWEAAGLAVPTTYDEFLATVDKIKGMDDGAPLCVGIESGQATGWPFTDWVEELVLRQAGPDVYDQWVNHEIPFNDPAIVSAMQAVLDLWGGEGNVFASGGSISATAFQDNAKPLVDGQCWMHRQANFFAGMFPEGTKFADGSEGSVDVFYFPDVNADAPVLTAGTLAGGFNDNPATMAVLQFMGTAQYAEMRQAAQTRLLDGGVSGYLSAAKGQNPDVYQPLEQNFLKILEDSKISRFDGSDMMPPEVGAGTFWSEGTSAVNGDLTAQEAADAIEASWPTS